MDYRPHPDAEARIASALRATQLILTADLLLEHKRELLNICLWKMSLAEGKSKYETRFASAASIGCPIKLLAHEHVCERAKLVQALLSAQIVVNDLRKFVVACTVLRTEHALLTTTSRTEPGLDGWDRYRKTRIAVIDRQTGFWLIAP
ncbi:MAG: hypothetical protein ABIO49_11865 [Dokdonella sp.]